MAHHEERFATNVAVLFFYAFLDFEFFIFLIKIYKFIIFFKEKQYRNYNKIL